MKVLHVFSAPQSAYYFMEGQMQYMISQGLEINLIIPNDRNFSHKIRNREGGVEIYHVSITRKISPIRDILAIINLLFYFLKIKPAIIHLHTPKASFLGVIAAKLINHKKVIYHIHGLISIKGWSITNGMLYFIEKSTCYLADQVFAVSQSIQDFAIGRGYVRSNKIKVIGNGTINGIDWENKFNRNNLIRSNGYLNEDLVKTNFVIGYVGRICLDKGIEDYLKVLSTIQVSHKDILGVIVGPNEIGGKFGTLLEKYVVDKTNKIILYDEIPDPENIINQFDVLLLPTKREGFGLVAAEANSLEIPFIGYDIPGLRDAIDNNKTGFLVEYNDIKSLKNVILKYYNDPELVKKHGEVGRKRVMELYDRKLLWEKMYNEYQNINLG